MENSGAQAARDYLRPAFNVFLAFAVAAAAGCAVNPYIDNPRPGDQDNSERRAARDAGPLGSMDFALRYLDNTFEAYGAKVSEEYNRQQALSAGLLGLGGLIIGYAATSEYRHRVAGSALLGGTAYAIGTWNTNTGRTGIYRAGQEALTCARKATVPLQASRDRLTKLEQLVAGLKGPVERTGKAKGKLEEQLMVARATAGSDPAAMATADAALALALIAQDQADAAASDASGLLGRIQNAGGFLTGKVDEIRRIVDSSLDRTAADINSLPKALAGIADYVGYFTPASAMAKVQQPGIAGTGKAQPLEKSGQQAARDAPPTGSLAALAAAVGDLSAARAELQHQVALVRGALAEISSSAALKAALEPCGVAIAAAVRTMSLEYPSIAFDPGVERNRDVVITGGTMPYSAQFETIPAKGLNVKAVGNVVVVTTTVDTEAGSTHAVRVRDATGANSVTLTVTINGKDSGSGGGVKKVADAKVTCHGFESFSKEDVCLLQSLVKAKPVDGKSGQITCTAYRTNGPAALKLPDAAKGLVNKETLKAVRAGFSLAEDAKPDVVKAVAAKFSPPCPELEKVSAAPSAPIASTGSGAAGCEPGKGLPGAKTAFECKMKKEEMLDLRARLSKKFINLQLSPTLEEFDEPLRLAIGEFKKSLKFPVKDGIYTEETHAAAMNLPKT